MTTTTKKRHLTPAVSGYLAGLATAALAAVVFLLTSGPSTVKYPVANGDPSSSAGTSPRSQGRPAMPFATPSAPSAKPPSAMPQHTSVPLSPEAQARITPLEARLEADPDDLAARKQLAVVLLQNQQLMPAFEHASVILASQPQDPDGLYVHAVVRLAMGQAPRALELLDEILLRYPDHALALEARARTQRKIGDLTGAERTAQRARSAARGNASEVEKLITAASDGSLAERLQSSNPAGGAPSPTGGNGD